MNAVDTNVYVYTFDPDDPVKQSKAVNLIDRLTADRANTVLIWQVSGELLNQLRRWQSKGRITEREDESTFRQFCSQFELRLPSAALFQLSFDLRRRFSLSHWDSMLLAACKETGVNTLYSEDMDAGTDYDGLRIVNPFA
jgi:predicted nucleic acid-binding protein